MTDQNGPDYLTSEAEVLALTWRQLYDALEARGFKAREALALVGAYITTGGAGR